MKDEEKRLLGPVLGFGQSQRLEATKYTKGTNAVAGIRCHLYALAQAVTDVESLQKGGKAFAGA